MELVPVKILPNGFDEMKSLADEDIAVLQGVT